MRRKKQSKSNVPVIEDHIEKFLVLHGVTDDTIDALEKEGDKQFRLMMEKWNAFCEKIMNLK